MPVGGKTGEETRVSWFGRSGGSHPSLGGLEPSEHLLGGRLSPEPPVWGRLEPQIGEALTGHEWVGSGGTGLIKVSCACKLSPEPQQEPPGGALACSPLGE